MLERRGRETLVESFEQKMVWQKKKKNFERKVNEMKQTEERKLLSWLVKAFCVNVLARGNGEML